MSEFTRQEMLEFATHMMDSIADIPGAHEARIDHLEEWQENQMRLTVEHVQKWFPGLSHSEAVELFDFSIKQGICRTDCFGDGSIMFGMWKGGTLTDQYKNDMNTANAAAGVANDTIQQPKP